jgi:hypothetical protein
MQFSFGKRLLRAAMSLGFLGCLMAQGSLLGAAATSEPLTVTTKTLADASGSNPGLGPSRFANPNVRESDMVRVHAFDFIATGPVQIGVPNEFSVVFEDEDSVEMFRFDVQQRILEGDRTVFAAKAGPKIARNTRVSISPPLLV